MLYDHVFVLLCLGDTQQIQNITSVTSGIGPSVYSAVIACSRLLLAGLVGTPLEHALLQFFRDEFVGVALISWHIFAETQQPWLATDEGIKYFFRNVGIPNAHTLHTVEPDSNGDTVLHMFSTITIPEEVAKPLHKFYFAPLMNAYLKMQ